VSKNRAGFTLVESLIVIAVFTIVMTGAITAYQNIFKLISHTKIKTSALGLANERIELIRNMSYSNVGIVNGIPVGSLENPVEVMSYVAPKNLETASTNGALFVRVFDANGQPVQGAEVEVRNIKVTPNIVINDVTNASGMLQLVDVPPGTEAYNVIVTKSGYSTDETHATSSANPNPSKRRATVALQQVTQISFAIDQTGTIDVTSVNDSCTPIASVPFTLQGTKEIGTSPTVYKYPVTNFTTNSSGARSVTGLEWDSYLMTLTSNTYDLIGTNPLSLIALAPNSSQAVQLVLAPRDPRTLLVTVKDQNGLPISDAAVTLSDGSTDLTLQTGRGAFRQTDWSGGGSQDVFVDPTKYLSSDGNVEVASPVGDIQLKLFSGVYVPSGELISSTFDAATSSNFYTIVWQPEDQPVLAGAGSIRFQLAANNDNATWNFTGPDGTSATWYTVTNKNIHASISGNQYLRYKVSLQTADISVTPNLSGVAVTYTSDCAPPGQVVFTGLSTGAYTLTVDKSGFDSQTKPVTISSDATHEIITLLPN